MVTLEQEAAAVMQRWADQSEALAPAQPYGVLAAFFMSRSQAKGAAAAHFQRAQRLQSETLPSPPTLNMLIEALGNTPPPHAHALHGQVKHLCEFLSLRMHITTKMESTTAVGIHAWE